ncbi:MAG: hypothetical protein ABIC82_05360 [bacterium]
MTKKKKIVIIILAAVLLTGGLMAGWFLWTFSGNLSVPKDFLTMLPATKEQKELYGNRKNKKSKKQIESCADPKIAQIKTTKSVVDSDGYKKMWGYIDDMERLANGLKVMQTAYDIFGDANPDAVRETLPYFMEKTFEEILALPKGADFAMIDAMCDPSLEWETKFWLSQILGNRGAHEALPLFREIAEDENEPFSLRVSSMDQIGSLRDGEASNLMVGLLDNNDDIIRDKASAILRDITDQGNEQIYKEVSSRYYTEEDEVVKGCLLGSMIAIGGDMSIPEVREILKNATRDEKDTIAILLENVHSDSSVELLKDMYDPQDENSFSLVISSLASLGTEEANQFLYEIIEEANGLNSVMAAEYLKDQKQKGAILYIKKALEKETNEEFIKNYEEILTQLNQ